MVCKGPMFDFYVFRYSGDVLVLCPWAFCDISITISIVVRKLLILRSFWQHGMHSESADYSWKLGQGGKVYVVIHVDSWVYKNGF